MTLLYADTSAIVRAYIRDEPDHTRLRTMLLESDQGVITSEIARVELASAVRRAAIASRVPRWRELLDRFEADVAKGGPLMLLELSPEIVLPTARALVLEHRIRTLDALHLATALEEAPVVAAGDDVVFVTRDRGQATAAAALGFSLL